MPFTDNLKGKNVNLLNQFLGMTLYKNVLPFSLSVYVFHLLLHCKVLPNISRLKLMLVIMRLTAFFIETEILVLLRAENLILLIFDI